MGAQAGGQLCPLRSLLMTEVFTYSIRFSKLRFPWLAVGVRAGDGAPRFCQSLIAKCLTRPACVDVRLTPKQPRRNASRPGQADTCSSGHGRPPRLSSPAFPSFRLPAVLEPVYSTDVSSTKSYADCCPIGPRVRDRKELHTCIFVQ